MSQSSQSYIVTDNQNQSEIRKKIESIIGANNLEAVLDDVVGSAQDMVRDMYQCQDSDGEVIADSPIQNLYAGDATSEGCIIWVKDPKTGMAYSAKMEFKYLEHQPIED